MGWSQGLSPALFDSGEFLCLEGCSKSYQELGSHLPLSYSASTFARKFSKPSSQSLCCCGGWGAWSLWFVGKRCGSLQISTTPTGHPPLLHLAFGSNPKSSGAHSECGTSLLLALCLSFYFARAYSKFTSNLVLLNSTSFLKLGLADSIAFLGYRRLTVQH